GYLQTVGRHRQESRLEGWRNYGPRSAGHEQSAHAGWTGIHGDEPGKAWRECMIRMLTSCLSIAFCVSHLLASDPLPMAGTYTRNPVIGKWERRVRNINVRGPQAVQTFELHFLDNGWCVYRMFDASGEKKRLDVAYELKGNYVIFPKRATDTPLH